MELECAGKIDLKNVGSKYRLLFECALDMAFLIDITGKIKDANRAAVKEYGYSRDEMLSMNVRDFRIPDERGASYKQLKEAFDRGAIYETVHMRKDGSTLPVEVSSRGLILDDTKMLIAIVRNITKRKEAERNLSRIAAIVESSDDAILGITVEGIITDWNHGAEKMYGYTAKEMIGESVDILIPKSHVGELSHIIGDIKHHKRTEHMDTVRIRKDGKPVYVSLNASPITSPKGAITGISWTARDITERKRVEEALVKAKTQTEMYLDLMGHDISNMNQIAMGFLEMALESFHLTDEERQFLEKPLDTLKNTAILIENIRKLKKLDEGISRYGKTDLCVILKEVKDDYSHIPGRNVTINFNQVPHCYVIANEFIKDIFSNLVINAIKHSDPQKPLAINMALELVRVKRKDYYEVTVEDNGPGIPDELKSRLFMRFQRGDTKASGKGLGLYLVRTLVAEFQGKVWIEDRVPGDHRQGSKFVVMLPASK